jgi:hypothetical protein
MENTENQRLSNLRFAKLLLLYVSITAVFLLNVALNRRGYQDSWILQGIFIQTAIFVAVSLAFLILSKDNRFIAVIGSLFLVSMYMIPGLKYELFYGTFDVASHYGLIQSVISSGSMPTIGGYADFYSGIPGMHVFLSSLSLLSGLSVNTLVKFILPLINGVMPLFVYFASKGAFSGNIQKYVIIFSSFPLLSLTGYTLTGAAFALIFFVFYVAILLRFPVLREGSRKYGLLLLLIAFSAIISHSIEPFLLVVFLLTPPFASFASKRVGIKLLSRIFSRRQFKGYLDRFLLAVVLMVAWWSLVATYYFNSAIITLQNLGASSPVSVLPSRLFEIPLSAQISLALIGHAMDLAILLIAGAGLGLFLIRLRRNQVDSSLKTFFFSILPFVVAVVLIILSQLAGNVGGLGGFARFIVYLNVLSIFFAGFLFGSFPKRFSFKLLNKSVFKILTCFLLFCFCIIQAFMYQPLAPRANVISDDLPQSEYLFDFREVTTIYKASLVSFAQQYSRLNFSVASDTTTRFQMNAFSNSSFASRNIWFIPLMDPTLQWDIFLLQTSDKAGPFNEPAEYRSPQKIDSFRLNETIAYDNGGSVILWRPPIPRPQS